MMRCGANVWICARLIDDVSEHWRHCFSQHFSWFMHESWGGGGSQWSHICAYKRATLIWQPADLLPNPPAALRRCSNLAARVCMLPCTTSSPCHRAESRSLVCFPSVDPCMWLTSCSGVLSSKDRTQLDCCPGEWGGGGYTHTRHAAGTFPLWGSLKRRM